LANEPLLLWTGLIAVVGLAGWALFRLRVYLAIGAGYKAKVLGTAWFVSGRRLDPARAEQVTAESYWLLRPFSATVDSEQRSVTASLAGFHPRTAVWRDGLGVTLLSNRPPAPFGTPRTAGNTCYAWQTRVGPLDVRRVVDTAFEEPSARRLRRTYAIVVVQDGEIVAERYAPGIDPAMPLPGWSMAKSVLSALVGILVHEGRLALDQKDLLPSWRAPDPRAAITLEDLLRMRSGLRFSETYANPWSDVLHMLYDEHDTAAYAASRRLASAPGAVWSYSSGTSNILSAIIRRTVGDDHYHAWPREVLFDPLGMASALIEPDGAGTFVLSSYMVATARDWARYGQLWLDGGRVDGRTVLPPEWITFSTAPTPQSDGRYGAHWWLKLNPEIGGASPAARAIAADTFFAIGHEGQTLAIVPSKRLVAVRLGASIHIDAWDQAAFIAALLEAI
jgi:CubicO group peptidase (beta-lactamase class C family)